MNLVDCNLPDMPKKIPDWNLNQLSLSEFQKAEANQLRIWLLSQSCPLASAIAHMQASEFAIEQMRALENRLIQDFSPLKKAEKFLQILCKLVDAINATSQIKLPLPRIPISVNRPKNPLDKDFVKNISLTRAWRECMDKDLLQSERPDLNYDENYLLGRLFTSAILYGGLANKSLLVSLCRSLADVPESLTMINNRLAIPLSIAWQGEPNSEHRLWFADALTATLIAKLAGNIIYLRLINHHLILLNDNELFKQIDYWVLRYLKSIAEPNLKRPKTINKFLSIVQSELQYKLKPIIANFACRKVISHAPTIEVVNRIFGISPLLNKPAVESSTSKTGNSSTMTIYLKDDEEELEPIWLPKLRQALNTSSHADASTRIDSLESNLISDEVYRCFHAFARHLITSKSSRGNDLAVSTARKYLVTTAKLLSSRLDGLQLATLGVDIWEDIYVDILECCTQNDESKSYKNAVARAIREFHHFLVNKMNVENINIREVLGIGKGLIPVDANLINVDEYHQIFDFIPTVIRELHPTLTGQQKLITCAQLIFMLSFRCGLRRMEVLKLKLNDLSEAHSAVILIRPSHARRLKTKSSTRNLPLSALLSSSELEQLIECKKQRVDELGNEALLHEHFLFSVPELNYEFIPQETLFRIIHKAMRMVTNDESLRFHHLRHSFATWTFLRLMLSDLKEIPVLFPNQTKTQAFLEESKMFREKLYLHTEITRKHPMAVANLLGHSGPDVSFEHYVHCCDLLLNIGLQDRGILPQESILRVLSGRPSSTTYRWMNVGVYETSFRLISKRWPQLRMLNKRINAISEISLDSKSGPDYADDIQPEIINIFHQVLYQHEMHKTPLAELANEHQIPLEDIQTVHEKMCFLREMRSDRGSKAYRHRMQVGVLDRRDPQSNIRLACPMAPHMQQDINIVDLYATCLIDAIKREPELCRKVFEFYAENAWKTHNALVFKDHQFLENARQFIAFLQQLGIKKSSLQFMSFDTAQRSPNVAKWKSALGLTTRDVVKKIPPPRKDNKSAKKWFGIKPVFEHEVSSALDSELEPKGSLAFRYLMLMGFALHDYIYKHTH